MSSYLRRHLPVPVTSFIAKRLLEIDEPEFDPKPIVKEVRRRFRMVSGDAVRAHLHVARQQRVLLADALTKMGRRPVIRMPAPADIFIPKSPSPPKDLSCRPAPASARMDLLPPESRESDFRLGREPLRDIVRRHAWRLLDSGKTVTQAGITAMVEASGYRNPNRGSLIQYRCEAVRLWQDSRPAKNKETA